MKATQPGGAESIIREMLAVILALPEDKLAQVYRYAQTLADAPAFLQATQGEISAEDAVWDSAIAATGGELDAFVSQAMAEGEMTGINDAVSLHPALQTVGRTARPVVCARQYSRVSRIGRARW